MFIKHRVISPRNAHAGNAEMWRAQLSCSNMLICLHVYVITMVKEEVGMNLRGGRYGIYRREMGEGEEIWKKITQSSSIWSQ